VSGPFIDRNAVDDAAGDQIAQRPQKMPRVMRNIVVQTHAGIERHHFVIGSSLLSRLTK
jgi:hypothetical protein